MKKLLSVLLAFIVVLCLTSCGENHNYPLTVGQIKLKKAPEKVAVLNADAADVMLNLGYSEAITLRSDECIQTTLAQIPSAGAAASPDIDSIIEAKADAVFADETLGEVYLDRLRKAKINVFRLKSPSTDAEISSFYRTIGLIMGGADAGARNAKQEYDALYNNISSAAEQILGTNPTYTICYLSLDGEGNYVLPEKDSFIDRLLSATGSSNVTADENSTPDQLLLSQKPSYIFYDSAEVLEKLGSDPATAELSAVTEGKCYEIPLKKLSLVGISAALNVGEIMGFMYPITYNPTPPEPTDPTAADNSEPSDSPAPGTDLSSQYGITITESTVIDANSDPELITAMQQRFYDLGYSPSAPDGVLGSATAQYIKDFQYLNNFTVDGVADYDFLSALFSSDAVPRTD